MRGWIARLVDILRWDGLYGPLGRVRERLGWRTYLWLVHEVDVAPAFVAPDRGLAVREIGAEATAAYLALRHGASRAGFEERLRQGQRCFAVEADGQLVAVSWLALDKARVHALRRTLSLASGDAYIYDSLVDPAWRGRRVHHLLSDHLSAAARTAGARRLCCWVAPYNRRIRHALARSGFEPRAVLTSVDFGPVHRHWSRGEFQGKLIWLPPAVRG